MTATSSASTDRPSGPPDSELIAATAAGDETSFEMLYDRHVAACRRRARRVLAGDDWVDDVVQTVFLSVWTHASRFDVLRGSTRSWLLSLTHHKSVDLVREQERHHRRRAHEHLLDEHVDGAASPEDCAARADDATRLRAAVAALPSRQRETLALCFLQDLSQREVSRRLVVPLGTVKTRSRSGILQLREILQSSALLDSA